MTTHVGKGHAQFSGTQALSRCYSLATPKTSLLFSANLSAGFLGIRRLKKLQSVDAQNKHWLFPQFSEYVDGTEIL